MLTFLFATGALLSWVLLTARIPALLALIWLLIFAAAFLFHSLTVEVHAESLKARFGVGPIARRVPLSEVVSYRTVRNSFLFGFGVRRMPGGWLWNVSGFDALELTLKSGPLWRIGSPNVDRPGPRLGSRRAPPS